MAGRLSNAQLEQSVSSVKLCDENGCSYVFTLTLWSRIGCRFRKYNVPRTICYPSSST